MKWYLLNKGFPTNPMDKEEARQWYLDYCAEIERQTLLKKKMVEDNQYIEWVKHFATEYCFFDTLLVEIEELSLDDVSYLSQLGILFQLLESYASKRYISSLEDEHGMSYFCRYGDAVYQVGVDSSNEEVYFCLLASEKVPSSLIFSFEDVQKEVKESFPSHYIREELKGLYSYIQTLKSSGITDREIIETTALSLRFMKK